MNLKRMSLMAAGLTVGIIILSILVSLPFYMHDMSKVRKAVESGSKTMDSPYGTLEYIDVGEGEPVLVSHGTMGGYDLGLLNSQSFTGSNYRFIIPSRFGYLKSSMPADHSYEAQADSFAYLLDQLGIDKVLVQGASAGGVPAIQFAIRYPERCSSLVLLSTIAYAPPEEFKAQNLPIPGFVYEALLKSNYTFWVLLKAAPSLVHGMVGASEDLKSSSSKEELEVLDKMGWTFLPVSDRYKGWFQDGQNINSLQEMPLDKIKAPTLIIGAEDDMLAPHAWSRYTAKKIHNSNIITYKSGGHMLLGHLSEVREQINQFIANALNKG